MDKFRAMKAGRRSGQYRLMTVIVQYGLRVLTLGLFLSSLHWLAVVRCSVQSLFVVSLPGITGVLMRPLAFFIISNVIVIFLICESKLSSSSLRRPDIYEEYVVQSQSLQKAADSAPTLVQEEKSWVVLESGEKDKEEKCGEEEGAEMDSECNDNEEDEEDGGEEEDDELNKRFEDFIARVNMERKLEAARMLV